MKYIKFSYHLLCKHFAMSLLIIIQLAVSFSLLQGMISYTADKYVTVTAFEPLSKVNGLYFATELSYVPDTVMENLYKMDNSIEIATGITYSDGDITIAYYDPVITKYYRPYISQGKWFSDSNFSDSTENIPVVAFGNYKVGDLIPSNRGDVYYEVVGVSDDQFYFSLDSYGYHTDTTMVMREIPYDHTLLLSVITDKVMDSFNLFVFRSEPRFLLFAENGNTVEAAVEILSQYGDVNTFSQINEYGRESSFESLRVLLPFFVFMFVLSIVGMVGCVSLLVIKQLKLFSVMFMVGATRKQCILIVMLYIAFLLIGALLISNIISSILFVTISGFFAEISFICLLLFCGIVLCTTAIPILLLNKKQPLNTFKRNK